MVASEFEKKFNFAIALFSNIKLVLSINIMFAFRLKTSDESGDEESQAQNNQKIDKEDLVMRLANLFL